MLGSFSCAASSTQQKTKYKRPTNYEKNKKRKKREQHQILHDTQYTYTGKNRFHSIVFVWIHNSLCGSHTTAARREKSRQFHYCFACVKYGFFLFSVGLLSFFLKILSDVPVQFVSFSSKIKFFTFLHRVNKKFDAVFCLSACAHSLLHRRNNNNQQKNNQIHIEFCNS